MVLALLLGCPESVLGDYERARAAALADPPPIAADWEPDAVLHLSPQAVDVLIAVGLDGIGTVGERAELLGGKAFVHPKLAVRDVRTAACDECLAVDVRLAGDVIVAAPGFTQRAIPVQVDAGIDLDVAMEQVNRTWEVTARPTKVRDVTVRADGVPAVVRDAAADEIEELVSKRLRDLPEWSMDALDGSAFPVRAARVAAAKKGIRVDLLTEAATPEPVRAQGKLADGWRLDVSQDSLLDLARRASFEKGPISHDVVADPRGLRIGHGDFELDLRLWMTSGSGWWRDYTITGTLERGKGAVALEATDVVQKDSSAGAAMADPLAYLGEGVILTTLQDSAKGALPVTGTTRGGGFRYESRVTGLSGSDGVLSVTGSLAAVSTRKPGR